jgi:hypothetical protein
MIEEDVPSVCDFELRRTSPALDLGTVTLLPTGGQANR